MDIDTVIKLGGSAITEKEHFETVNLQALRRASALINNCLKEGLKLVIVHGAGSFGHHQAKQYKVNQGYSGMNDSSTQASIKRGFCLTRQSVLKLQHLVIGVFIENNLPAVGLSVCGSWKSSGGKVIQSDLDAVCSLLSSGFLPVLHGDCVLDSQKGCSILSGDTIIKELCEKRRVGKVLFLTDVEGIYNKPPRAPDAELVPFVSVDSEGRMLNMPGTINMAKAECDVTGGIRLKLETAVTIVTQCQGQISVFICKLGSSVAEQFCRNSSFTMNYLSGTLIYMDSDIKDTS